MAQIDTSTISGFDAMTPEDQVKALLAFQYDDGAEAAAKLKEAEDKAAKQKAALDKATSEAAGYKKQLNAKLTEDERKQQESESTLKAMQEKLAEYEQRERLSTARAMFLGGGFDDALAGEAADAFISQDTEKFTAALKKYRAAIESQTEAKLMGNNPKPVGGEGKKPLTKEDILKIEDYTEQQDAVAEYISANGTW